MRKLKKTITLPNEGWIIYNPIILILCTDKAILNLKLTIYLGIIAALLSTAAQHGQGGASTVFHNALGNDASNFTDEEIINKIYNERKKVDKYFSRSSIDTQSKLKNIRFPKENAKALELLKSYKH